MQIELKKVSFQWKHIGHNIKIGQVDNNFSMYIVQVGKKVGRY